jgi:hypothetical protein
VRDDLGAPLGWDLAFLAFGLLLIIIGVALARSGERNAREREAGAPTPSDGAMAVFTARS